MQALDFKTFKQHKEAGATIIDTRDFLAFQEGFIPGSLNFTPKNIKRYALEFLKLDEQLLLITNDETTDYQLLEQLGYSNILGHLEGGFAGWQENDRDTDLVIAVEADEYNMDIRFDPKIELIDIRDAQDFEEGHIEGAESMPVVQFSEIINIASLDEDSNIYIHCGGGSRSFLAASLIKKHGLHNIRIINGGFKALAVQDKLTVVSSTEKNTQ